MFQAIFVTFQIVYKLGKPLSSFGQDLENT